MLVLIIDVCILKILKFPCEITILLPTLSAFENIAITLPKAKRNDFVDCSPSHDLMVATLGSSLRTGGRDSGLQGSWGYQLQPGQHNNSVTGIKPPYRRQGILGIQIPCLPYGGLSLVMLLLC